MAKRADRGSAGGVGGGRSPRTPASDIVMPDLPPEMFSPLGILTLADTLPVMTAYVDSEERYRFLNKPLAEWFERPRSEILGRTLREVLGEEAYAVRAPLIAAALKGERQYFASDFDHPTRGPLAVQTNYVPWFEGGFEDGQGRGKVKGVVIIVADVTEQRATERALRESEERFRRIANSAPVMMWVTRLDRSRDFVNDAYAEFAGLTREQARTFDWRTIIHPDDVDRVIGESLAGEASLKPFTLEGRYRRHDGEYRWLRSVSSPRFGPDGELNGFIGVASDITLAKEAELELRRQVAEQTAQLAASEAQFRAVFEAALEVMVLLEPDGTVLAVNNRREVWRHPNPTDAIGQKLWDAPTLSAYPQHIGTMKAGIAAAARGEVFTTEVKMEREGVPTAYLDVSVQPVRGPDGAVM